MFAVGSNFQEAKEWYSLPEIYQKSDWVALKAFEELLPLSKVLERHLEGSPLPRGWAHLPGAGMQIHWKLLEQARTWFQQAYIIKTLKETFTEPFVSYTLLYELGDERFELVKPIPIKVETYKDETICSCIYSERYGWGETYDEALGRLKENILVFHEALNEKKDETLSKQLRRQKRLLNKIIKSK